MTGETWDGRPALSAMTETCEESVRRPKGEKPCGAQAIAMRRDEEGQPYLVCLTHIYLDGTGEIRK